MKTTILALLLQIFCLNAAAQQVIKETHLYSVKGADSLLLDRYYTKQNTCSQELKPAIIFMFGGAFYTGTRNETRYISCFEYYAQQGYEVFSIDYRLGLKGLKIESVKPISQFVALVDSTINLAVEDLYDATTFVIGKSEKWGINPQIIVPFGSSAGAISILQGEYYRANGFPLASKLPEGFEYAGVISMAGAIFSTHGKISWNNKVAPILMFQGDADRNVPYNRKRVFKYGFYGSKSIAKSLTKIKSPYYFCTYIGAGHEVALLPMDNNRDDIDAFLSKLVRKKQPLEIVKTVVATAKPKVKTRFKLKDYLMANFAPN